jgi:hypothetical protein
MANIVRYPKELVVGSTTDYIEFETIERDYKQTTATGSIGNRGPVGGPNRMGGFKKSPLQTADKVLLPIPQKISEANRQTYNSTTLGPEVEAALTGSVIGSGNQGNRIDLADIAIRLAENAALDYTSQALNKLGGTNLSRNAILSATSGVIYNPMMEVLYDGPQFRTFNYQFLLFAKSADDAKNIFKIVRFFQQASAPSTGGAVSGSDVASAISNATAVETISGTIGTLANGTKKSINDILQPKVNQSNTGGQSGGILGNFVGGLVNTVLGGTGGLTGAAAANSGLIFGGTDRFIKNPPHMLITYKRGSKDHPYILSPQPCVIDNIQIDYTPGGSYTMLNNFASSGEATTVSTLITLTLTETKITYQDYYQ